MAEDPKDARERCPVCGVGVLADVAFDADRGSPPEQSADSHELQTFTCGHEVEGAKLSTADADRLAVERRASQDTVTPIQDGT